MAAAIQEMKETVQKLASSSQKDQATVQLPIIQNKKEPAMDDRVPINQNLADRELLDHQLMIWRIQLSSIQVNFM